MGHLHVSKIKFRHPVPEVFSPKKAAHTFLQRDLADKATGIAANKKVSHFILKLYKSEYVQCLDTFFCY